MRLVFMLLIGCLTLLYIYSTPVSYGFDTSSFAAGMVCGSSTKEVKVINEKSKQLVKLIQTALNNAGFRLDIDGIYGPRTERAVYLFQQMIGIDDEPYFGKKTLIALVRYL